MKRKAVDSGGPEDSRPSKTSNHGLSSLVHETNYDSTASFDSMALDPRLLLAIKAQKFSTPTPIQSRAIPILLRGRSLLARAHTGSGKTAAYILPILQRLLEYKSGSSSEAKRIIALILVPTRELTGQVTRMVEEFARQCHVRVENLARKEDIKVQRARIQSEPDIVVSTPGRVVEHINGGALRLDAVKTLVVDEADLASEYGYIDDLFAISKALPIGVQTVLMSATLRPDSEGIRDVFKGDMEIIELDEEQEEEARVKQYVVQCAEDEKFLLCYALFILKLVKGKTIIFVADIDRCYKVKLFLEQFGVKSCVLNSELPVNSRVHVVEEFNKNVYDIIIATDESQEVVAENSQAVESNGTTERQRVKSRKVTKRGKDSSYGVSRGVDFQSVSLILNFDLPPSPTSYTHRIGRTGRAGRSGMAISFVIPLSEYQKHKSISTIASANDEAILVAIVDAQKKLGNKIEPYQFDMSKLEGFRYRLASALKAVTLGAVREARLRELRQELINSEKLKRHFEENPADLKHLRHDGELHPAKVQPHMKHVPDYLVPGGAKKAIEKDMGFVSLRKRDERSRGRKLHKRKGKINPLQSFKSKKGR